MRGRSNRGRGRASRGRTRASRFDVPDVSVNPIPAFAPHRPPGIHFDGHSCGGP